MVAIWLHGQRNGEMLPIPEKDLKIPIQATTLSVPSYRSSKNLLAIARFTYVHSTFACCNWYTTIYSMDNSTRW